MKLPLRLALCALPLFVPTLEAEGPWAPAVLVDPSTGLEVTPAAGPQSGNTLFVGVLFDEAVNSLELGRFGVSTLPPVASFVPIATGSIFALGGIDQAAGFVGFSYINPTFDLTFARCAPPCNTVPVVTIDSADVWIDSASAASADDFFVAGLNDTNDSIRVHYSSDGGATWHFLNSITPPNLYVNFNGGKRISLVVDPAATDPATTRNCLLYETRPTAGTTTVRVNCRNGASPLFDVAIDSDVPNPSNTFDRFIETTAAIYPFPPDEDRLLLFYSRRGTQQFRRARLTEAGAPVEAPIDLGAVPPGSDFYTVRHVAPAPGDDRFVFRGASDEFLELYNDPLNLPPMPRAGPPLGAGPHTVITWANTENPANAFLLGFGLLGTSRLHAPEGGGVAVTWRAVGLFDDSFETGSTARWGATSAE